MRINLPVSQAVTVVVSDAVGKMTVADPKIADAQPITNKSIYVVGKAFGTTTVNLYGSDGSPEGLLAVQVGADTADMARSIRQAVPTARIHIATVNGRVALSGSVPDAQARAAVLQVVSQYGLDTNSIIDSLTFAGAQQVNLEVRILEVQRNAARELGFQWGYNNGGNSGTVGSTSFPSGDASFASLITQVISSATGFNLNLTLNALEAKGLVRTLADPNLTTLSGGSASFLAGGQVPIRVPDANGNATLTYKDFGVKLNFTPIVLDGHRIQIQLMPEVSDLSGYTSAGDPIFTTRTLDATVELRDGQSFSVAGLLQSHAKLNQNQLPWLGDVPILGSLFKSSSFQKDETELVVIVTPRLVRPSTPAQIVATPFDKTAPANDLGFFAAGQMEVARKPVSGPNVPGGGYILDMGSSK
jgi:pilus assembly protein CpaC